MKALISTVAALVDYLARDVASTPRVCDACGRTFARLTPAQCAQIGSKQLPACRRRRCDGRLWLAPFTGDVLDDLAAHPTNTTGDPS